MAKSNPLDGKLVVLIGGSGFLGTYLAQELLQRGARLRIASREPQKAMKLKPLAMLGQIQFVACDVRNEASLRAVMRDADAAVYAVGSFSGDLATLHVKAAGIAAQAAKDEGASAFAYISAIGADAKSDSTYARTKAEGEEAVRRAFPGATIVRPSVMFGSDDRFITMFADLVGTWPVIPVFAPDAKLQPVWVADVAEAVANALSDPAAHGGQTFEVAGPEVLTMYELNERIAHEQERKRHFIRMPDWLSGVFARLPGTPMNPDQWAMLREGNVASGTLPSAEQLGVVLRPLELFLGRWMLSFRRGGRFSQRLAGLR